MDPAAAATDIIKQARLRSCKQIHRVLHFGTFFCTMYISTGKYTVSGQKPRAPRNPTTSLKNGMSMEMTVVSTTKRERHVNRKRFRLYDLVDDNGMMTSFVMNSLFGQVWRALFSMNAKRGWQYTCF